MLERTARCSIPYSVFNQLQVGAEVMGLTVTVAPAPRSSKVDIEVPFAATFRRPDGTTFEAVHTGLQIVDPSGALLEGLNCLG